MATKDFTDNLGGFRIIKLELYKLYYHNVNNCQETIKFGEILFRAMVS